MIIRSRRALLGAGAALLATPALAQNASNMPVIGSQSRASSLNVIDTLAAAGNFNRFITLARLAGRVEDLRGAGPFTLLAPTDDAIGRIPAGLRQNWMGTENTEQNEGNIQQGDRLRLMAFVDLHIIPGRYTLAQLASTSTQLRTLNGNVVEVASQPGQEYRTRIISDTGFGVGGVNAELRPTRFLVPEMIASNGVVLPIDVALIQ
ncbi:fasciclin domain-containing protein [Sabulicella rubraurantiaca]|uniref:fasciclin domain-containing protein n=1 Tax=Sabulicella rubraurantiaca TaxID=2811429 RepID=UPI001A96117F|nr:fasciclin domain-containing protein [Sabulicella rubraurantiaca]